MPLAIQHSDRSPLHDVRNHACHFIEKFGMRNCFCFADGLFSDASAPGFAFRASPRQPSFSTGLPSRSSEGAKAGGARRDRTDDLLLAKQALSQLSYGPEKRVAD